MAAVDQTNSRSTLDLAGEAQRAKADLQKLEREITAIPGRLLEIRRRLKSSTDEEVMRRLIKERVQLQEDQEVKPGMVRAAKVRALRAEAEHVKRLAEEAGHGIDEAIAADVQAKADLEVAEKNASLAAKRRARIENRVAELTGKWRKLASQAESV